VLLRAWGFMVDGEERNCTLGSGFVTRAGGGYLKLAYLLVGWFWAFFSMEIFQCRSKVAGLG